MLDQVTQVINWAGQVWWQCPESQPVEEIALDKIERQANGLALQLRKAVW